MHDCSNSITIGKFRDLHRLTVQYARILDMTLGDEEKETTEEGMEVED